MPVKVKRVYEAPAKTDGARILVDRLWPRGLTKQGASIERWLRDIAASNELRHWFHANSTEWSSFRRRYLKELGQPKAMGALEALYEILGKYKVVTLLYASRNEEHNNAVALKELLDGRRKPPTGTGSGAYAQRRRSLKRAK